MNLTDFAISCLAASGCDRMWRGDVVRDPVVGRRLADADGRLGGLGAALLADGTLVVSGGPAPVEQVSPGDASDAGAQFSELLCHALERALAPLPTTTEIHVDDWHAPAPDVPPPVVVSPARWLDPPADAIDALASARAPVVLAGPGVVRAGCVPGLHALAARRSLGVLNTWGAKGVYDWRSPHHVATGGLQARDFELAGFADADLIVAVGVDPLEAGGDAWQLAPVLTIEPGMLDPLADALDAVTRPIERAPLFTALAAPTQAGWTDDSLPLAPTRITRQYAEVLGAGGIVAADPGVAGFFVARTFATTEMGSVQVPGARDSAGFAVAAAVSARLRHPGRAALAVVEGPLDDSSRAVLEAVESMDVPVAVAVWDPEADPVDADHHIRLVRDAVVSPRSRIVTTAYAPGQLQDLVAVAGPVIAWQEDQVR